MAAAPVNVSQIIDSSRIGSFQIGIYALCFACLAMDGFDVQSIGYVAPALSAELGITRPQLGPVLSAAPLGVLIGSILSGILADRWGRRPILIGSTIFFSIMTLLTARAGSLEELRWIRAIGGIGMGAIMPNAMALVGEYSPRRARVTVMMIVSNGFTAGAALGGFVAAWMLPQWGWRSVFYFGAVVPLFISVLMIAALPESIQFLTLQGRKIREIGKWLQRVNPTAPAGPAVNYSVEEEPKHRGLPFVSLLQDGRAMGTLLLWIINFMNLLNIYLLQGWLTTFFTDSGIPQTTAALIASMVQVGGTVGAFTLGWFVHKIGFVPVLATCSLIACVNIAAMGQPWMTVTLLFIVVFVAGLCVVGGQAAINSLSATYYPTDLRATGIGAGLGVGRLGAILGPTLVSFCLQRGWTTKDILLAAAVPPLISFLVMVVWNRLAKPDEASTAARRTAVAH